MSDYETKPLAGAIFDETTEISVVELCEVCSIDEEMVAEMIAEGILEADARNPASARLSYTAVKRTRTVIRLQRDLGVNMAGAALALELLDRIENLRTQLRARRG